MDKEFESSIEFEKSMTRTPYTISVKYERYKRDSNGKIMLDKQGKKITEFAYENVHSQTDEVFFISNIYELFGVPISYKGMSAAINKAYLKTKAGLPKKTGYSMSYFKLQKLDNYSVKLYYDKALVGGIREGREVKTYYPLFFFEMAKHFNFLDIAIKTFYDTLYAEVRKLFEAAEEKYTPEMFVYKPSFTGFEHFIDVFNTNYYAKREKAKQEMLAKDEAKKKLAEKVKELKAQIKLRQDEKSKIILQKIEEEK